MSSDFVVQPGVMSLMTRPVTPDRLVTTLFAQRPDALHALTTRTSGVKRSGMWTAAA
jgi:hypothetical protein